MNKKISEFLKRLTISILLLIFSFVLLTPTANALEYDPKLRKSVILPIGDGDPWDVPKVTEIQPDNNRFSRILNYSKFGFTSYFYFKFGWDFDIIEFDDSPIIKDNIIRPDDSENDTKQTNRNR